MAQRSFIGPLPTLPVTERNKLLLAIFVGFLTVAIYGVAGRLAIDRDPRLLPLSALDLAVPIIPWTFWIYASVYCIYALSCIFQRDLEAFGKFLYGYIFAYATSALIFLVFPTTFPRELFPLGDGLDGGAIAWSEAALGWFRTVDHPTNCFPSMHVGSAVMATLPFYRRRPVVFVLFCIWGLAISLTTITTKQHYVIDVVAGAAFGWFSHHLVFHWVRYKPLGRLAR